MTTLGWGQGTYGNNPWGGFISVDVSVTGFGLTSSLGTIPAVHGAAPVPIFLGWGEGGWDQNAWGGRESTAFGVDGFGLTSSLGSVTVTGTGAVSLTGVAGTTTLDFDSTTDIVINETAVIDFRDSLMATSFSQEFGLTVDGFVQDGQTIGSGSNTEDITTTERTQDIVLAAEMDLPSSFTKASCIWEVGGTGSGAWFGISEQSSAYFLRFRAGDGTAGNNTTSNSLSIAQVAVSTLPQFFDDNTHTVVWAIDRSIGKTEIYIDGQLVADGQTSDGSSVAWAGTANGGFGSTTGTPPGGSSDDGSTQFQSNAAFTGTIRSDLRMYKNEFIATQTAPASFVGSVSVGVTQSQISSNIGSVDFDGQANAPVTGLSATSALGNETAFANVSFAVTGLAGTSALGNEEAAGQTVSFATTVNATGAVGNTVETGTAKFTPTGVVGTSALGEEGTTAGSLVIETGLSATGAVGTATAVPSIEPIPTGVSATGGVGDALAAGGAKVVEDAIVGTVNIGDEAVSAGANVSSTGVSATGSISSRLTTGTQDVTTFTITVAAKAVYDSGSNNAYYVNGVERQALTLIEGQTYHFDQSDSSNYGHPLRLSTTSNGTHGGGSEFTNGVVAYGTPGTSGAYTEITVPIDSPTLYYYCSNHSNMGNTAATFNSTVNVIGGNVFVPTGVSATNSVGEETIALVLDVATSGLSLTGDVGTLAIEGTSVVSLTGVSGTGGTGQQQIYGLIVPNQDANWIEKAA